MGPRGLVEAFKQRARESFMIAYRDNESGFAVPDHVSATTRVRRDNEPAGGLGLRNGHGRSLEDGSEHENRILRILGVQIGFRKIAQESDRILQPVPGDKCLHVIEVPDRVRIIGRTGDAQRRIGILLVNLSECFE
jgi:hypothetical protein